MTSITAIRINDNFTACQTSIPLRSANNETTCRVNEIFGFSSSNSAGTTGLITCSLISAWICSSVISSACCVDTTIASTRTGLSVNIFNRYLCFAIRTQIVKCAILTNFRQTTGNTVCQCDRKRHKLRRFIDCKTEHQTLVACTNCFNFLDLTSLPSLASSALINALCDISRLFIQRSQNSASLESKPYLARV